MKHRSIFLMLLLMASIVANAEKKKIGDLWYTFSSDLLYGKSATVVSPDNGEVYSGEIIIPTGVYINPGSEDPDDYYSVCTIGGKAFAGFNGLTVHIPNSVYRIVPTAFDDCEDLTIDYASVKNWCNISFNTHDDPRLEDLYGTPGIVLQHVDHFLINGEEVVDLVIPEGVTKISEKAFYYCRSLRTVTIPSTLDTFGAHAFACCPNLENVTFSEGTLKSLPPLVFYGCDKLESVTLPSSLKTINHGAFTHCTSLEDINWPETLVTVGDSSFMDCSKLKYADLSSLSEINKYAFYGCTNLDVTLPDSCDIIDSYAFYGNTVFKSLNLHVNSIGNYAFAHCTGITQLSFGYIGYSSSKSAFEGCTSLKTVSILPGTKRIEESTFKDCTALSSVKLPEGFSFISYSAFSGCSSLASIDFPESLLWIESGAFNRCTSLASIHFPEGLKVIGDSAFGGCSSLEEITIPESVARLENACPNCDNLKSVNIKRLSFWMDREENNFSLKGDRKLIANGELVTEVVLPTHNIKPWFKDYEYLECITIPDGNSAILNDAFDGCDNLSRIYCYAEMPPRLSNHAFSDNCIQLATVYVPGHLLEAYQQDELDTTYWPSLTRLTWSMFRIEAIPNTDQKCATPTIVYENGKLSFTCDTEGAKFITLISDPDMGTHEEAEIELTATYHISVYATAKNHINSDLVKATLCWIDRDPQVNIVSEVTEVKALPVLIEHVNGTITVRGLDAGQKVAVYSLSGQMIASAAAHDGTASLHVGAQTGSPLLVKIGKQTIKIL